MKNNILNCIKKISAGFIMSDMIIGSTGVSVKADNHNFYTYYNDANIKQTQDSCIMPYYRSDYKITVTSINGNTIDKITPLNGTVFSTTYIGSGIGTTNTVRVIGGTSSGKAQFLISMYQYSANSLLNGTIYKKS